jgi:monodehydroascorbate reductase (NADH)
LTPEVIAGAARLPGFHTCVGANDELLTPKWYKEQGRFLMFFTRFGD